MTTAPRQDLLDSLAKPPPPPSELDELMARDPLELSAQDIDKIIAFQRAARARREGGAKTKKADKEASLAGTKAVDLVALVKGIAAQPSSSETKVMPITAPKPGVLRRF